MTWAWRRRDRDTTARADEAILRAELFGTKRFEELGRRLAAAPIVPARRVGGAALAKRLRHDAQQLQRAHAAIAAAVVAQRTITPAAEWLLDNQQVVVEQIAEARAALPARFHQQLPTLAAGPLRGLPRVFGLARAYVTHSDSHLDPELLVAFVRAHQQVQPLTIGELWAVPIMLRLVLVENVRRAAQGMVRHGAERAAADDLVAAMLGAPMSGGSMPGHAIPGNEMPGSHRGPPPAVAGSPRGPLGRAFAAQMVMRLRDHDPEVTPALAWLDERLAAQGSSQERIVADELLRQGATNLTVQNGITSMRRMAVVDWNDFFERVSTVDAALAAVSDFGAMDFPSRDRYRHAVEALARSSGRREEDVVAAVVSRCRAAADDPLPIDEVLRRRHADPGQHLLGAGRRALERQLGCRVPLQEWLPRLRVAAGIQGHLAMIATLTSGFAAVPIAALLALGVGPWPSLWLGLLAVVPASDLAVAIVHRCLCRQLGPVTLPGLELRDGVPATLRTLVAVPTMLTDLDAIADQVERLEVHFLASPGDDLVLALLSDWGDADDEHRDGDEALLAAARAGIAALNHRHGPAAGGERFLLLHRHRVWNAGEGQWIGWERKRGKLHELNRWLRGATDTTFFGSADGGPTAPRDVRYVLTLDADTRLPPGAARRLVGKMAHPLNRPSLDPHHGRVRSGHAVLQPRITPALPDPEDASWFQRVFSGPCGLDPYANAVSDVYQDLLGEGSYAGKGIYDVDAFAAAQAARVPECTVLSHDLLEGTFARAGLVSDIEIVEDFPARYDVAAARQHRWARGDWQLLPWILGRGRDGSGEAGRASVPFAGRWKMFDNLRRTLIAPASVLLLAIAMGLGSAPAMAVVAVFVVLTIALPGLLPFAATLRRFRHPSRDSLRTIATELSLTLLRAAVTIVLLAHQALLMGHAILTALHRTFVRRRHMLQWLTAAQAGRTRRLGAGGFYRRMQASVALALGLGLWLLLVRAPSWPIAAPLLVAWCTAPLLAQWLSRTRRPPRHRGLEAASVQTLRTLARRTWSWFETFVGANDQWLPPDNFQEIPQPVVAHRTSPTNIGLYLLSVVAARDFGWLSTSAALRRLEDTLDTLQRLEHHRGHLFNWYSTRDLRPLEPRYVSTVDSGNLAAHLLAVGEACRQWAAEPAATSPWQLGLGDTLGITTAVLAPLARAGQAVDSNHSQLLATLAAMRSELDGCTDEDACRASLPTLALLAETAADLGGVLAAERGDLAGANVQKWAECLQRDLRDHLAALAEREPAAARALAARLTALHERCRTSVLAMQFGFLYAPGRRLLSIGFRVDDGCLDSNHYDLLASEARLASFVAIAKGDVPASHWYRLGRGATRIAGDPVLMSWSGSLFEYVMPALVLREPPGSLLAETNRRVVRRQIRYGAELGVPWGISESAYNARDLEHTYQYSSFGVPGLGQKRGLAASTVIAPYATALASMYEPRAAVRNFAAIVAAGGASEYGYQEALDYTPESRPPGTDVAVVRATMAHHQGMSLVALANTLHAGIVRRRFHRSPTVQAAELLLQEQPQRGRSLVVAPPRPVEVLRPFGPHAPAPVRRSEGPHDATPRTHLLGNGNLGVLVTAAGAGGTHWRGLAVTRWREDPTAEADGSWIYLRDVANGAFWSAGYQPTAVEPDAYDVAFAEGRAEIRRRDGNLTTRLEVAVSPQHDAEVRRVSITNSGGRAREIDVTSYAELVLGLARADAAHPAFARLFVQTEHIAHLDALLATRRRRGPDEAAVWAAHLAVVEGTSLGAVQYETDRARFVGRCRTPRDPLAIAGGEPLSGRVGSVLDAIFSLRVRLRIAPGQTARIAFWTLLAPTRDAVLALAEMHRGPAAFERTVAMAWTHAQVQLQHLGMTADEALLSQRLANRVLCSDPGLRPHATILQRSNQGQAALWPEGISGDLPIVLLRVAEDDDLPLIRQVLRAHAYWRSKRLAVDLVILDERAHSYAQDLQTAIEALVRSSQPRAAPGDARNDGRVHSLRVDRIAVATKTTLQAAARVVLSGRRGSLATQLRDDQDDVSGEAPPSWPRPAAARWRSPPPHRRPPPGIEAWNGLGGFTVDGREYTVVLADDQCTPAPWINVVANPHFGFQVSAEGAGYTWSGNSRENQLSPWSNDPTGDPAGEAFYLRDLDSGALWSPTAAPARRAATTYTCHHGQGYSRFEHETDGLAVELLQFVPLDERVKFSRLRLTNRGRAGRRLSLTAYVAWVLGAERAQSAHHVVSECDLASRVLLARNPWRTLDRERVACFDLGGRQQSWTGDRREFLGRHGSLARPLALATGAPLSGRCVAGSDPCGALQASFELAAGASIEFVATLGEAASRDEAVALALRCRRADVDALLQAVHDQWNDLLGVVQVRTPDRTFDLLWNRWLLYQTVACRLWARSAFYQAGGAYGFRDQLQDTMALVVTRPDLARAHLLRAAARQYEAGDVQHWWLPHTGRGVRTRVSDDALWLVHATVHYVTTTGDTAVLDEVVPFLSGPPLAAGEAEAFQPTSASDQCGPLFEHCARALDRGLGLGVHGLPPIGTGDWNDGFNRVGAGGQGESVWLGWFLHAALSRFAPFATTRGEATRATAWRQHATALAHALDANAWDGAWYRRGYYDDGRPLGSATNAACRIDSLAQTWAVLAGAGDAQRAVRAMASLYEHLVRPSDGLVLLFTPPFADGDDDPGYVRGYPPGIRENGGQYSHAAAWAVMAFAALGDGDRAHELFGFLNPIRRARTRTEVQRYKLEPYAVGADVYSVAPHVGRGGWSWYTGAAGVMYRAGLESILGFRLAGDTLHLDPCVPRSWRRFELDFVRGGIRLHVLVENPDAHCRGVARLELDGVSLPTTPATVPLRPDGRRHEVRIVLGPAAPAVPPTPAVG
ncbi:MAG: GH36-type glycosyl hydrolase domain-containing protein [Planctomycetota bacterium]|jgi:cyclic beta-1,2-glucan synthetase